MPPVSGYGAGFAGTTGVATEVGDFGFVQLFRVGALLVQGAHKGRPYDTAFIP